MPPSMLMTTLSTGLICTPMIALTTGKIGGVLYFTGWPSAANPYTMPTNYNGGLLTVLTHLTRS